MKLAWFDYKQNEKERPEMRKGGRRRAIHRDSEAMIRSVVLFQVQWEAAVKSWRRAGAIGLTF